MNRKHLLIPVLCVLLMLGSCAAASEYAPGDHWDRPYTGTGGIATAEVIAKSVTMRDKPTLSASKVVSIPAEACLTVQEAVDDDWVKATYTSDRGRSYTGYVRTAYIVVNPEYITLRRSNTPAYSVPSREGKLIGSLPRMTSLCVMGTWGDYYVVWLRGGSAFIRMDADVFTRTELNELLESTWNEQLGGHRGRTARTCSLRTGPGTDWPEIQELKAGTTLDVSARQEDGWVFVKAVIVLSSWISGYFALKHLPLTLTGPIKATQPVLTLLGALLIFGERLNGYQWAGVLFAIASFYLLSASGRKEGIRFTHNRWIWLMLVSITMGAVSGLYDKHLMRSMDVMTVQVWFNLYQLAIMSVILLTLWYPNRQKSTPFQWRWNIIFISVFLCVADWIYFYALTFPDSMISIVSMVRRSSVLVTFTAGALFFHEKNLKSKAFDLLLVLLGMICLYLGTK